MASQRDDFVSNFAIADVQPTAKPAKPNTHASDIINAKQNAQLAQEVRPEPVVLGELAPQAPTKTASNDLELG